MSHQTERRFATTFRFTKTKIQEAIALAVASGKKQVEFCDAELPNFRLMVYPSSGKGTFMTRYRLRKRRDSIGHGDYRVLHLESAREMHRQVMRDIAEGKDPKESRKAKATFAECVPEFLKLSKGKKRSYADDVAKFEKRLSPKFGRLPLDRISASMLNDFLHSLHTDEGLAPATVNRYGSLLRTFFVWAGEEGHLPSGKNPMSLVRPFTEDNAPTDFMSVKELGRFIDAAMAEENYLAGGLLSLLGLTGGRLDEWRDAEWSQIDWKAKLLKLPASKSKNKRDDVIMLSNRALEILSVIASEAKSRTGKIFPGLRGNKVMSRPVKAFDRICEKAKLTGRGFTIHSLRHAFGSALANAGVPVWVIQMLLRHRTAAMVERYCHVHAATLAGAAEKLSGMVFARKGWEKYFSGIF